ncbi:vWA domain-containing protein [uncultured Akkermansia sp.]|uniref:vWA domain-containing protein n=1 Tax=uncultured Akkermansia sp. TaxID=512294 RepID=UPI00265D4E2E|nr:vWA domain-containing protein [uncultured Akkermansia sp.]
MMNRIITCTLGLLGAGAFCAYAESPSVSADGRTVPAGKDQPSDIVTSVPSGSVTVQDGNAPAPPQGGEKQDAKTGTILLTVKSGGGEKAAVPANGTPAGEQGRGSCIEISRVGTDQEGTVNKADYSIRISEEATSGKKKISVAPQQEKTSSKEEVSEKGEMIITQAAEKNSVVPEVTPIVTIGSIGKEDAAFIEINGDAPEKARGAEKTADSIITLKETAPGKMEISIKPKEEDASPGTPAAPDQAAAEKDDRAVVQIALLLDTSGSMNGLIDQARTYLWKIVNDMTLARQNGKLPSIQIALYEYGNDRLSSKDAWIRRVLPFTDDLDRVSDELFKLKTYGGTECCGAVIDRAMKELAWNKDDPNALKLVFIAGNEPFNQGSVPYAAAIARGLERGITVNTIHCGDAGDPDTRLWKDGAAKGDGSFLNIDHNAAPPEPETPYDGELARLSSSLNTTYLAYGSTEVQAERIVRQERQDKLARELSPAASVGRASAKANKAAYFNTSWDLVDLYEQKGNQALEDLGNAGQLPQELAGKTAKEMEAIVKKKAGERADLQKKVKELDEQRSEWLAKWKEQQNASGGTKSNTLDDAIIQAVRRQASKKQFSFVEENKTAGKNSPMNERVKK